MNGDSLGSPAGFRSGFVVVAGRTNVGKSTLVNGIVGDKVSIVSDKPQTTRRRVAGVLTKGTHQLVLLDVPGFQKPMDSLTTRMQETVDTAFAEVDGILFVLNGKEKLGKGDRFIASRLKGVRVPVVVAINKVDLLSSEQATAYLEEVEALGDFHDVLTVSALTGSGVKELTWGLEGLLPEGPAYFPPEMVTDQPEVMLIAELIREKVLALTRDEVPHSVAVEVVEVEPRENRDLVDVRASIYVERNSQKGIVVGRGGQRIKSVGIEARTEIERVLGSRIFLDLSVKVRPGWRQDPGMLNRLEL